MVEIGDWIGCPKCGNYGRVVWVSKDGETAGVRCSSRHRFTPKRNLISTRINRKNIRFEKNRFLGGYIAMGRYYPESLLNHDEPGHLFNVHHFQ